MMRISQIVNLPLPLLLGLVFFVPVSGAVAAEISLEEQQAIAEECIAKTEKDLELVGILPSEESAEYDNKFDDVYSECMHAQGLTDAPIDVGDELSAKTTLE
jgi:hypothetical protein